ncbi:hypothetical protein GCM10009764_78340 [Nocardia ninae]|uniref:Uncharacterized protein n=1 Tax=Nocardia ninae NBRC 108245 TaxID=1210091 RepID=A0A511MCS9_9NOCA|nr:hypothetical protein NN4_29940 [Nocardia ninae NBRC 108245]
MTAYQGPPTSSGCQRARGRPRPQQSRRPRATFKDVTRRSQIRVALDGQTVNHTDELIDLRGIRPPAARLLVDTSDIYCFANRDRFLSWNDTVTLYASSVPQG